MPAAATATIIVIFIGMATFARSSMPPPPYRIAALYPS
jgi:hypothetical protein